MMNPFTTDPPKISIVTPSFNQGQFLEQAILSVVNQHYPNLEYIIIDGGSSDDSLEIIKKYESHLHYWCSEPDEGHYHAINKGFSKATGDIFAWLNSDDLYCPWALQTVGSIFSQCPEVEWLSTLHQLVWDDNGNCVAVKTLPGYSREAFVEGCYLSRPDHGLGYIQQESTFWRRDLWERRGGLRKEYKLAGDFDLWARFFEVAELYGVAAPLGGFRYHGHNRSLSGDDYYTEAVRSLCELRKGLALPGDFITPPKRDRRKHRSVWSRIAVCLGIDSDRQYTATNLGNTFHSLERGWEQQPVRFRV